jgi:hypothetical protein
MVASVFGDCVVEADPDVADDAFGGFAGTVTFADDDALPFVQEAVAPEKVVYEVFGEGEHQVHQREGKQDVGVYEDARHGGVGTPADQ